MIYTFYSFKGGVGRSMALANIAELFYACGLRVLMIDFDLEAPGLERYFDVPRNASPPSLIARSRGVIDLLLSYLELRDLALIPLSATEPIPIEDDPVLAEPLDEFLTTIYKRSDDSWLKLLPAGQRAEGFTAYAKRVLSFDWEKFYSEYEGERLFEWLRKKLTMIADVVLIDSRTGVTEMGGVCTHQLADVVVSFVGTNEQNLQGTKMMAWSLSQETLITTRGRPLELVFVPSRVEPFAPEKLDAFELLFNRTLDTYFTKKLTFEKGPFLSLRIPYSPEYAYTEDVAVRQGDSASKSDLIEAFQRLGSSLALLAPEDSKLREAYYPSVIFSKLGRGRISQLDELVAAARLPKVANQDLFFAPVQMRDPAVFISSTAEDLKEHREQLAKAARASGFSPKMMEYLPATGDKQSLQKCRELVAEADVVVVIVAHRYGWVPDDASNPDHKSITWLECEHARGLGKEVLAFIVDPKYDWPDKLRENYRLITERKKPGIGDEVDRNEAKLEEFKRELSKYFRAHFTDAASLRALVSEALADWRIRHFKTPPPGDPETYLKALEDETRQIRIKGLRTSRAEPYFFGIDEIYIPLTTQAGDKQVPLDQALSHPNVVIIGEPGAGKSTFLRRKAYQLCRQDGKDRRFPILIRVAELAKVLAADKSAKPSDSPDWIPYFLGQQSEEYKWRLDEAFFRQKLDNGNCLVMLDGLDEAPERRVRERMARIFERATQAFAKCDFLVSTRPQSYTGDSVLAKFQPFRIADLERDHISAFFNHFARALALSETESKKFKEELELALDARQEISEMARNPLMLTALAVLQHNDQRLPEYRVELYGSILNWLAAAREHVEGLPADRRLEGLKRLALTMQDAPGHRVVQMNKRDAAELWANAFGGSVDANDALLERETQDSGIISSVGSDLKFWHLSFQEWLAAREIASLNEKEQTKTVFKNGNLYRPEWRETMRLLGGLLRLQGEAKIEGLFRAILGQLGDRPTLADQARCAALLGAMMRDLARMGYQPKTPDYARTVKAVMRIFDATEAEKIDLKTRIEAADALGQVGDPRLEEDNWVVIPAGTFWMGAQKTDSKGRNYDPEARDNEAPVREVRLKAFRIGKYPVTVQEFAVFINDGGYATPKYWSEGFGQFKSPANWEKQMEYPSRPVVSVSWYEASAYCAWAGCRLPTEAEWERTARGPDSCRFPWGNEPPLDDTRANFAYKIGHPIPVGLYPKGNTSEGVCDLLGNVWEWCSDKYADQSRVLRGGSWGTYPVYVRASDRVRYVPEYRYNGIGFRCTGELP